MQLTTRTQDSSWYTEKSRLLLRISGDSAEVAIFTCAPEELEALATACLEAAAEIRERQYKSGSAR